MKQDSEKDKKSELFKIHNSPGVKTPSGGKKSSDPNTEKGASNEIQSPGVKQ